MTAREHADTIREALRKCGIGIDRRKAIPLRRKARHDLDALEAELAEARRDIDDGKRRAGELCVQFVLTEDRCAAAEAEVERLRAELGER